MDARIRELLDGKGENYIFPFLWMHGEEEPVLREYMHVIHEANIGAVCVESRPHPDFVGPGWWSDMDIILEEAKKLDMKVWILDDSHFPTGYANGAVKEKSDELCRQNLAYQIVKTVQGGHEETLDLGQYRNAPAWKPNRIESYQFTENEMRHFTDDRLISITAVKMNGISEEDIIDLTGHAKGDTLRYRLPEGVWRVYLCHLTRNRGPHRDYINMLDRNSCQILLDAVYEPHYAHYGSEFGKTIAGFFSDEPEIGNGHLYDMGKRIYELDDQPWSARIENELKSKWGKDFAKYLPLLWEQEFSDRLKAKVRYTFMDAVTRAVKEEFSLQIGDWCRSHGVEYIGHLIEDNGQHTRTGSSLGHYFRGLFGQDMAGIDDIGGQVFPQGEWAGPYGYMGQFRDGEFYHYVLGKLGSSLAAVDPLKKGRAMCEIFGNYGWEEGLKLEKYLADHFLVRGINHYVPHAFSMKEFPDPDCPPHFYAHGHNPQYRHFGALMKYINRVCHLISGGRHKASVAILYNAEAEWSGHYMELQQPARSLADRQIEYDFIPADVFMDREYYGTRIGKVLEVNGNTYQALVIPQSQYITEDTAKTAGELAAAGGKVFFLGQRPEGTCDGDGRILEALKECRTVGLSELVETLDMEKIPEILLKPADKGIRYIHYEGETSRYFFVNEGTQSYRGKIQVPETGDCYRYDPWENRLESIVYESSETGTILQADIEPGKSLLVVFDEPDRKLEETVRIQGDITSWNQGWKRSLCTSLEYPAFAGEKEVFLPDCLAEEQPLFSGFARYENTYVCETLPKKFLLEITDAGEGVEVFVNGISAGIQITAPYRYDLTALLKEGKNNVCIETATTLEREMSVVPDPMLAGMGIEHKVPACPMGIHGEVRFVQM